MPRLSTIGVAASGAFGFGTNSQIPIEYLVIAGGGAGAYSFYNGGAGGAGGYAASSGVLTRGTLYAVVIGGGV